jgi:hypothetical protein
MKRIWQLITTTCLLAAISLLLSACGGGGATTSTPTPKPTTLSGMAAAGAPIIGSVTIKDSTTPTAMTKTVPIAADGNYTVDVSDLKAPYMVRADGYVGGNEYHLYSAGTSADVGGTINITPLTDLIVANIAGSIAKTYFDNGSFSNLTATELTAHSEDLKAKLLPILQAVGVSSSIDLLRASFSTDHTGLDAALDQLKVETNTTTGVATITNIITQQQITSNVTTGTYSGTLTDTAGVATGATDIQAISAGFKKFSDLFATSLPSETNPTLLGLFDSATFMQEGQNLAAFLSQVSTDKSMIGISFTNISIQSMNMTDGTAVVGFSVIQNGKKLNDAPDTWNMIKKNGVWYLQGDLRIANVKVRPRAQYQPNDSYIVNKISTGFNINIEDRGGKNITKAVVTGKGLPSQGLTMINQINNDWFTIQGTTYGTNFYTMDDASISAIADSGEVYTIQLYIGTSTTPAATYTEKIKKRPYLSTELNAAMFPTITAPTTAQLKAFAGGDASVSWTLPTGLTNNWLEITINDNSGNSARVEFSPLPADRSKSFTLNPITSTGQTFTITGSGIWLSAWDDFGREVTVGFY